MKRRMILFIQWFINEMGILDESLEITGRLNDSTWRGMMVADANMATNMRLDQRAAVMWIQKLCQSLGIDCGPLDGLLGPQTEQAFEELLIRCGAPGYREWERPTPPHPMVPQYRTAPSYKWPKESNKKAMEDFFGKPGENLVRIALPYKMKLAWDPSKEVSKIQVNKKVAESIEKCLTEELEIYGQDVHHLGLDLFGGVFNNRKKRGGEDISVHAYGAAIDRDPMNNRLRWNSNQARFSLPVYEEMREIWRAEGWIHLGQALDFDWMHWQAARP